MRPIFTSTCVLVALCALSACGTPDNTTPAGAITAGVAHLQNNNLAGFLRNTLPADRYQEMADQWDHTRTEGMSDQDQAQMNMMITQVRAENAEETLFTLAKPQLALAQEQLAKASAMVGMLGMMLASPEMSPEEHEKLQAAVQSFGEWLQSVDLTDESKVKQAISIVCSIAQDSQITKAKDLLALDFAGLLAEAGPALDGLKNILALYGFDLNRTLQSVQAGSATIDGASATVPVTATVFGQTVNSTAVLTQINGRWYNAKMTSQQ